MSKFKIGDLVEIQNSEYTLRFPKGCRLSVDEQISENIVQLNCTLHAAVKDLKKIEVKMSYQNSKRYKLHQAIKKIGHTATDLSIASGHGKFYFGSEAKESRFNSRGDLSDKQYNNLITNLAFAERKLNEVPAVTVEDEKPKVLTLDDTARQQDYQRQVIGQLTKQQTRKRIAKSKTEVNKKTACFVLFLISVVFIFVVTGVVKDILP